MKTENLQEIFLNQLRKDKLSLDKFPIIFLIKQLTSV